MNKEEVKNKILQDFKIEALKSINGKYAITDFYSDKIDKIEHFKNHYGALFVEVVVENLALVYKDLSKINTDIIVKFLYDLWEEHEKADKELDRLQGVLDNLIEGEHRSIRAKVEAVNVSLNKIKVKENLKHRFLEYIEKLLNIFSQQRDNNQTSAVVNIKFVGGSQNVEIIQADIEKLEKKRQDKHE